MEAHSVSRGLPSVRTSGAELSIPMRPVKQIFKSIFTTISKT